MAWLSGHWRAVLGATGHVLRLSVFFVVWCFVLTWMVESGALWSVLRDRLLGDSRHWAQDALVSGRHQPQRDVLMVGDPLFLERARENLPDDLSRLELPISAIDLYDAARAIRMAGLTPAGEAHAYRFGAIIVQVSPHYFSDVMWRGHWPDYRYWEAIAEEDRTTWLPNSATQLWFDLVQTWAATPPAEAQPGSDRPPRIERRFIPDANPVHLNAFVASVRLMDTPTILVTDRRQMDFSATPEILRRFDDEVVPALAGHKKIGSLVHWSGFGGLASALDQLRGESAAGGADQSR